MDQPLTNQPSPADADPLAASFDYVRIAEEHGERLGGLETAVEGVKADIGALRADSAAMRQRLDRVALASGRPVIAEGASGGTKSLEAVRFVSDYLRRGIDGGIKSFTGGTGPDGGFAMPREIDAVIERNLVDISPIRRIANVVQVGSAGYRKLVTRGGTPSGWVSETGARPETQTPVFAEIVPPMGELYANPAASQAMLDDAAFDVEGWLASEIAEEFARAEGAAFVKGTGTNQPRGFLSGPTPTNQADGVRPFGTLQYVISQADGNFPATNPQDRLTILVHNLRPAFRQGAVWVMNSSTLSRIQRFKTSDGAFLWQPSMAEGLPSTLLGYPVVEAEDMPDVATGSFSIAFGNFRAGYLITERTGTTILRDPFTNKPYVHFYATRRVGGQVLNSDAIKLMRFTAT